MSIQEIEQHNKIVETERKAYHERRCAESEDRRVSDLLKYKPLCQRFQMSRRWKP